MFYFSCEVVVLSLKYNVSVIQTFEDELRYNCKKESADQTARQLLAIRALGNIGKSAGIASTLDRCALNEDAQMNVRVAAISAYRRMDCTTGVSLGNKPLLL